MLRDLCKVSIVLLLVISCDDGVTPPKEKPKYSEVLTGKVFLENQTEHSNALVYIDNLNRGVSTDSSGNYTFEFDEKDSAHSGEYKVLYFLINYERDSAKIVLVNGKVKLDTLDVDREGKIKTKEMKQTYSIEGWTDKQEYKIGDYLKYTERRTNILHS